MSEIIDNLVTTAEASDVSHILNDLNDAQRQAVTAPSEHMLVLAGAGSGKTRVLVHRIAWLNQVEGVSPYNIFAVTFTNKAAAEMRQRVEKLQAMPVSGMWVGTFHGLAHRLLRTHWKEAGLPQTFQILDSDDQYRLVRRVLKNLELDEARWPPKQAQAFINARKDEGKRPQHVDTGNNPVYVQLARIYTAYEAACERAGVIDFAELLLRTLELVRDNESLQQHYQKRFLHILVDEFQDTNTIQYALIRLLAGDNRQGKANKVFIVGDDDQAIYGWRGAKVENIHLFQKHFPTLQIIRLEQNYRSTTTILSAANSLIDNNHDRLGKKLWSSGEDGEPIIFYHAFDERDEARFVIDKIKQFIEAGNARADAAILYRSNAQSRVFEEQFVNEAIPYRVYGGMRFFERAEIRNALAYLRLMDNRKDDASFERVVNTPTRGIGERSVDKIRDYAREKDITLWQAAKEIISGKILPTRAANSLHGFLQLIEEMRQQTQDLPLHEQVDHVVHNIGLIEYYEKEKGEKAQARVENIEELITAARGFDYDRSEMGEMDELTAFLTHAALEAGEGQASQWDDCVQLMTMHSAKGLEFPLVFIVGLEEGLFPSQRSLDEEGKLEEERRLCYVGVTRARQQLVLCCAEHRRLYGQDLYPTPSRFVSEIPENLIQELRTKPAVSRTSYASSAYGQSPYRQSASKETQAVNGISVGQRVTHAKFGDGIVTNLEGSGSHARVEVNFEYEGSKWLVMAYANLQSA